MNRRKSMTRAALIATLVLTAHTAAAGLAIRFETDAVRISGAVRGGRVACIFVDRAPLNTYSGSLVAADTDNDGEVRVAMKRTLSDRAVWAAVDLETGEFTAATAEGTVSNLTFHGHSFRGNGGDVKQLESQDFERLDILLVRPHAGAWTISSSDGGPGDSDRQEDRKFVLDVESMQPVWQAFGPAPRKFEKGDVVVLIDPSTSDIYVAGVGR
ncbi:MAG TPA: hypothetical protein VK504_24835 [Vicinamibacterales bacterium]|nr:hypothetical protein [Vicinamibacterales bacterium]